MRWLERVYCEKVTPDLPSVVSSRNLNLLWRKRPVLRSRKWKEYHGRKSYGEAIRESQRTVQMVRINIAANELLRSLLDIGTNAERRGEQREILCALNDLRIMIRLHRKYA